jgi:glycosyltransferase involved in cell wall biosynthesis
MDGECRFSGCCIRKSIMSVLERTPGLSIVVPVYRNAASLRELAARVHATLAPLPQGYELLLVDDGSPDDSWTVINELSRGNPSIRGIRLSRNFGQHPAIAAGFERARGDIVVLMDADLEDRPENIPDLISLIKDDVDIAFSIKRGERPSLVSRLTSHVFHAAFSLMTGNKVPPSIGTFRAFTRKVLLAMQQYPEYNVLYGPLMFYIGFNPAFLETVRDARHHGTSSYSFRKRLSLAIRSLASYTDLPIKAFFTGGAVVFGAAVLYGAAVLLQYFLVESAAPSGLTLLVLIMMFFMSVMMIGLGVIGSYLFRVYQEVLRRPRYLVTQELNPPAERA